MTLETAFRSLEVANARADAALDALERRIAYIDRVGGFMSGADQELHRRDKAILASHKPIAVPRTKTWRDR
jgi:hypothetical protein